MAVGQFDQNSCFESYAAAADIIWVMSGTYPNDYRLSQEELDLLAELAAGTHPTMSANGPKGIYFESADHWGFQHVDSMLDERDGIEPDVGLNIQDGDDTLTELDGEELVFLLAGFYNYTNIAYSHDTVWNEFTDRLAISGTTAGVTPDPNTTAGVIWRNSPDEAESYTTDTDYIVGVRAVNNLDNGRMISSSFEFGGFAGDTFGAEAARDALAAWYILGLEIETQATFVRGDSNNDGSVNVADAVHLLGHLFPNGIAPNDIQCADAADTNADGNIDIGDAIAILSALFGSPAQSLPAPYPACGTMAVVIGCDGSGCP